LTAYDFGDTCVRVVHEDGSVFFLENAFIVDPGDDYIWVFTEHQGDQIFAKEDLLGWNTLSCVPDHSVNYVPRNKRGFPDVPRTAEEIVAEQMPGYKISDEPNCDTHENIQIFYLTPENDEDEELGDKPITVAVSVVQGRIIGRQF
jgi:hypothetical protein